MHSARRVPIARIAASKREELPIPSLARSWRLSLRRLHFLEISRIRRCLVLLGGHQEPIPAQEIRVRSDDHVVVALGAGNTAPVRMGIGIAPIRLVDAPRPRQRMIEYGDFLMKEVWVVLVEVKPFLEGRLVV